LSIRGKTALVTASSKGLGRGAALALAQEGANVVISARGEEALEATRAEIAGTGAEVLAVTADMSDPATPQRLVDGTLERFGSLDILIGNNGGPPPRRALDVTDDEVVDAVNGNLVSSIRLVRAAAPAMRANGWGRICLFTSFGVKQPIPDLALSNIARTGLWAWAKTAAMDLFDDRITLNLLCPGLHATERAVALGRADGPLGDPEDFGKIAAFLCSEPAGFIAGAAIGVDGATVRGLC
ncbi:MAG: SDR family oxidoreductase, partial [Actinomycetota bacterium]